MSKPMATAAIRRAFLDFFAARNHVRYPSASLVPANDPTTLFTVAGMSQFKDMFLGRGSHAFTRATTCQKCIRTNDIENVGQTPRHHTFFEMLGNFSFDDYFKREAITLAWEFLTGVLGLDPERLWISVNHIDEEAWQIWTEQVGIPERRLVRLGDKDNFWPANAPVDGPTGPGGCCSEIFWDFRTNDDPDDDPGKDTGRFVEVWNLVFPQFNVSEPKVDGRYALQDLGRQNIDTGMGLERIACVMQGVDNNFDIDLLQIIVQRVVAVTGQAYVRSATDPDQQAVNALLRRVADHVRAVSFCIADGALPANVGRGYIVRRLIRRAVLDLDRLGVEEPCLHEVLPAVVAAMGDPYTELVQRRDLIGQTLLAEERQFRKTLRRGLERFERCLERHRAQGATVLAGEEVFDLFTTYGFPKELTADLAEAEGLAIDERRFTDLMQEFAKISKGGREIEVFKESDLLDAKTALGSTVFVGYDTLETDATLTLLEVDGKRVDRASAGTRVRFSLDRTPFYGESGGEVGDTGTVSGEGFAIMVTDTQKDDGLVIHHGEVMSGTAVPGPVRAAVDNDVRCAITRHHSATHLLHGALCAVLGEHVEQQGSKVEESALRFDFNHPQALDLGQLQAVESWVLQAIAAAHPVTVEQLPIDAARERGAKALFGEKYGTVVRVITMGQRPVSVELCGGCHVTNTADIGAFRILKEEAVAAGIRRITAIAGQAARQLEADEVRIAQDCATAAQLDHVDPTELAPAAQMVKVKPEELPARLRINRAAVETLAAGLKLEVTRKATNLSDRIRELAEDKKRLERLVQEQATREAVADVDAILGGRRDVDGVPVYTARLDGVDAKVLRQVADTLRLGLERYCLVLAAATDGKALILCAVSPDLIADGVRAGDLVGALARIVDGGGGGRPDIAQAGGRRPEALDEALAAVDRLVRGDG